MERRLCSCVGEAGASRSRALAKTTTTQRLWLTLVRSSAACSAAPGASCYRRAQALASAMAATLRALSAHLALAQRPSLRAPAAPARPLRRTAPRRSRSACAAAASLAPLALASAPAAHLLVSGDLSTTLFALGQQADALVNANLTEVTPATYAVVLVRHRSRCLTLAPHLSPMAV